MSGTSDGAVILGRRKQKRQGLAHDGAKDVVVQAQSGMWLARAARDGKLRFVGSFSTQAEAEASLAAVKEQTVAPQQPSANDALGQPQEDLQQPGLASVAEGMQTEAGELKSEEDDASASVQEAVRNLVVHVSWLSSRPPPPTHYSRANHATSAFAARVCRFGAACRRSDVSHWEDSDHPVEHPLMGQPVPQTPESGAVFSLTSQNACAHWRAKGFCLAGTACRFQHATRDRGCLLAPPAAKDNHRVRTTGGWRHRGRRNGSRGAVFRRFLIDEFGIDVLRAGSGVGFFFSCFEFAIFVYCLCLAGFQHFFYRPKPLDLLFLTFDSILSAFRLLRCWTWQAAVQVAAASRSACSTTTPFLRAS